MKRTTTHPLSQLRLVVCTLKRLQQVIALRGHWRKGYCGTMFGSFTVCFVNPIKVLTENLALTPNSISNPKLLS